MWKPEELLKKYIAIDDIEKKSLKLNILKDSLTFSEERKDIDLLTSDDISNKYKLPIRTLNQMGISLNHHQIYYYLDSIGYSPNMMNIKICTSKWKYYSLFNKMPARFKNKDLFTFAETIVLMSQSYSRLNNIISDSVSSYDFTNQNGIYVLTDKIILPEINKELFEYFNNNPDKLFGLTSRGFEELVADIFKNNEYIVELTPPVKDGGYDILAVKNSKLTGDHTYLIECKRYSPENKVGVGVVRSLFGVVATKNVTKGIITTTSSFTKGAKEFAQLNKNRIELKDYNNIKSWLKELAIKNYS